MVDEDIDLKFRISKYLDHRRIPEESLKRNAEESLKILSSRDILIHMDALVLPTSNSSVLDFVSPRIFSQQMQDMYNGLINYEKYLVGKLAHMLPKNSWTEEQWACWIQNQIDSPHSLSIRTSSYRHQILQQVSECWKEYASACKQAVRKLFDEAQHQIDVETQIAVGESLASGADDAAAEQVPQLIAGEVGVVLS